MKNDIFIIGEIGINHNGDIELAKKLIDTAYIYGLDAVKFQKRTPELCVPDYMKSRIRDTPWGEMSYIDYKHKIEFGKDEYDEINVYCDDKMTWFASAWDIPSLEFLDRYKLPYNKVASAMIRNLPLLEEIAKRGKKTFVSTGMCEMSDIDKAYNIFKDNSCPIVLMHCTSEYPCPSKYLNLRMINTLKEEYDCEIGYSSHFRGTLDVPLAVEQGARYIEKHITIDRALWGTDQAASLGPEGIRRTVRDVKLVDKILGNGIKIITDKEREKLKELQHV